MMQVYCQLFNYKDGRGLSDRQLLPLLFIVWIIDRCLLAFGHASSSIHTLITVGYVEEVIILMMLLVKRPHGSAGWWDHVVNKEEQSILRSEVDSLTNQKVKLTHCEI